MIIGGVGRDVKLLIGYLKGKVCIAYRGNGFQDFRSKKSKSGSSIIISYPWPMKIKVGHKSGVVPMIRLSCRILLLVIKMLIIGSAMICSRDLSYATVL